MKPLTPTIPSETPSTPRTIELRSSTVTPAAVSSSRELGGAVGVPVVVAEHGDDRQREVAADLGEHLRLLELAVRRQVAGEEHDVGLVGDALERRAHLVAPRTSQWMSPAAAILITLAIRLLPCRAVRRFKPRR